MRVVTGRKKTLSRGFVQMHGCLPAQTRNLDYPVLQNLTPNSTKRWTITRQVNVVLPTQVFSQLLTVDRSGTS